MSEASSDYVSLVSTGQQLSQRIALTPSVPQDEEEKDPGGGGKKEMTYQKGQRSGLMED